MATKPSTTTKTTKQRAIEAGAKVPQDHKAAKPAVVKAMQKEAAEGDVVVELHGETYTVHVREFQERMSEDYEFMEMSAKGVLPILLDVLLDADDHQKLKDSSRDEKTGRVSTPLMADRFRELMEAAGQGN